MDFLTFLFLLIILVAVTFIGILIFICVLVYKAVVHTFRTDIKKGAKL